MSRAVGTYGLTSDGQPMAAEAGAALSGMEFSGQYGVSHAAATVTKILIYDWAAFSDESGGELTGGDGFSRERHRIASRGPSKHPGSCRQGRLAVCRRRRSS
jgi:succinate dehydrogenase/fumarate reductase flavoprotein subunit